MAKRRRQSVPSPNTQSSNHRGSTKHKFLTTRTSKKPSSSPAPTQPGPGRQNRSFQKLALEEAKHIPDIRQERVAQIRADLESGEYHVPNSLVADRILKNILLDESPTND